MIIVKMLHPRATPEHVGLIPFWLSEWDPMSAAEQLNSHYTHGGGWRPFTGFKLLANNSLIYPGDPALRPFAEMHLRKELILMYDCGWVAVIQPNRSFEVCRMD
jgi:hypothetical protein